LHLPMIADMFSRSCKYFNKTGGTAMQSILRPACAGINCLGVKVLKAANIKPE